MDRVKLTPEIITFVKNFKHFSYKDAEEKETVIYDIEQFYFITVDEEEGIFDIVNKLLVLEIFMRDVRPNVKFEEKKEEVIEEKKEEVVEDKEEVVKEETK